MRGFLFVCLVSFAFSAMARPKIGLVLSGGGAKGAAHIGVLKILEANNVPIDYVVGTSIGSYIGGWYALGYSPAQIEDIMLNTYWDKGFSDFIPRENLLYEDKKLRDKYNLTFRLGYSDGKLKMPTGLFLGQSAQQLLKLSTGAVGIFDSFDDLAIPYRAVAADISSSEVVVLSSGSITQAMKASSAVPGALEPVEIDGKLLVDGMIANNMPVDVVRAMGADIIIAIDIGSSLLKKEQINSTVDILGQLSTILTINTTNHQKSLLKEGDLLIRPDIDDLSPTDFSILGIALEKGEQAALENLTRIRELSVTDKEFAQYRFAKKQKSRTWMLPLFHPVIDIEYDNQSKVALSIIEKHFSIVIGDVVSKEQLEAAIDSVYALNRFDYVNAEFVDGESGRTVVLTTKAKSWGPNYLHFGFDWQGDLSNTSMISVDFAYLLTDVTKNGGQWKNELSIGWESAVSTEFYQPLNKQQDIFSRIRAQYKEDKFAENKFNADQLRPELRNRFAELRLGVGYHYNDYGLSEIGFVGELGTVHFDDPFYDELDYDSLGAYLSLGYDSLNSINFPTQGNKVLFEVYLRKDNYLHNQIENQDEPSIELSLDWRGALGLGHHTFVGIGSFATVLSDNDFSLRYSELGGFLNLSGYQKDALIGAHKVFGAVVYQYDLGRDIPGGTGLPLYLGTSIESGNVWTLKESVNIDELVTAGSIYLGTDTSFGPAVIGVGYATSFGSYEEDEMTVFFSLGKNW
ncbi:patatin-like phospholipase family protein [Psychromonas hadalis]|uniref:patatin-like phospholipase family protein n=1 Tax=Psychromonas hadalis TaxID=211669 RepID=UPI0003B535E0|nr:patatin-like phospholipase family protein [Psychromonas hadalis]